MFLVNCNAVWFNFWEGCLFGDIEDWSSKDSFILVTYNFYLE